MSDHTTGDTGGLRRNIGAHPSPQVHLFVDSMTATGWQAHTVRGFVSGALIKKQGLKVESFRSEDKERTYRIA